MKTDDIFGATDVLATPPYFLFTIPPKALYFKRANKGIKMGIIIIPSLLDISSKSFSLPLILINQYHPSRSIQLSSTKMSVIISIHHSRHLIISSSRKQSKSKQSKQSKKKNNRDHCERWRRGEAGKRRHYPGRRAGLLPQAALNFASPLLRHACLLHILVALLAARFPLCHGAHTYLHTSHSPHYCYSLLERPPARY